MPHEARAVIPLNTDWKFNKGDVPVEALAWGNRNLIANETRIWQKADNHGLSRPENPASDAWPSVVLPHDFVIEGEFSSKAPLNNGSLPGGKGCYLRKFELGTEDAAKRIHLEFDGVYRDCLVHVNGHFIGRHLDGYTSFGFDITEVCRFGALNAVSVSVDATENELWSYEGGGIYRGVRLVKTAPIFIPQWGLCVRTGDAGKPGQTDVTVELQNRDYQNTEAAVHLEVLEDGGKPLAKSVCGAVPLSPMKGGSVSQRLIVENPALWTLERPVMHRLRASVFVRGACVDEMEVPFGYRSFRFDAATGFSLNGVPMKLKGVCCHQDHAGVGVAVPPALQEWRVKRLKEMGANAIRTSHNPPDPALLDACDRLGMMVMDEIRMPGIEAEHLGQVESVIRRDRNHPSVILWSLGNEEMGIQNKEAGVRLFRRLQHLSHDLDPTRPTSYAMNCDWINISKFHDERGFRFDVFGANYRNDQKSERYDEFHARHPDWPILGSETWGGTCTRGLYEPDKSTLPVRIDPRRMNDDALWADEAHRGYASAYQNWHTPWGYSIEETWQDCAKRPFLAGTFLWTGFDYRGETSPYLWPAVITRYGILDLCGFYKEVAHYLRAWWRPHDPHLFLMPHWNWEGREGELIDVWCYGNSAEVELFLNGKSLGCRPMPENFRLEWKVPFEKGKLEGIGYGKDGKEIIRSARRTALAPAGVRLESDSVRGRDGASDVIVVNAAIVDRQGEVCPRADDEVEFSVEGPAEVLGVGNGNPLSHEPDKGTNRRMAYHGLCQLVLERRGNGAVTVRARSRMLTEASDTCA